MGMPDTVLQKLDRCAVLLAECRTAEQAKRLADVSEAARVYANRVGASREVVNQAAEYKLRAERRLGEILAITERAKRPPGPGRGKVGSPAVPTLSDVATLSDMGLSKKVSSRAQKLAAVPADIFEAKIAQAKGRQKNWAFPPSRTAPPGRLCIEQNSPSPAGGEIPGDLRRPTQEVPGQRPR